MRLLAIICIVLLSACDGDRTRAPATGLDAGSRLAAKELDSLCYAFADRYLALMASACDALVVDEPDPLKRRAARRLKLSGCTAVYDIATAREPFSKLLDLTLVVTLQSRVWIDEDQAVRTFGERGRGLVRALRQARVEIWQVASRALLQPQLQELDWLIWDWRRRNPAVTEIAAVRFDEASAVRGRALADAVRSGGGLLAPISDAVTQLDESRELAERAFFQAKRLPTLIDWQVQGTLDEILLRPEVATALTNHAGMVKTIDRLADIAASIPAVAQRERQAALDAIGGQVQSVRGLVDEVRKVIADVSKILADAAPLTASGERIVVDLRETSTALTQTITAADALLTKVSGGPAAPGAAPGKPFDIAEYAAVVGDLAKMVKELNALVGSSNNLLGSNLLSERLKEVNTAAADRVDHASVRVESVVAMVFVRLALLLVFGFVLLLAYRWLVPRLMAKRGGP